MFFRCVMSPQIMRFILTYLLRIVALAPYSERRPTSHMAGIPHGRSRPRPWQVLGQVTYSGIQKPLTDLRVHTNRMALGIESNFDLGHPQPMRVLLILTSIASVTMLKAKLCLFGVFRRKLGHVDSLEKARFFSS